MGEGESRCAPHHPPQPRWAWVPSVPAGGGRCGCPPSQRRPPPPWGGVTHCLAVLRTYWGVGPILPHCPATAPFPPTCVPPPQNGSQVLFPSVPRLGMGGGVSSCCFPLPLGGLDPSIQTLPAGRLAALGPYLLRLQGRLTPCHPPKKQGVLLALVHRAATVPLTLPWVQLVTSWGACPCLSSCLLPPPRGCVLQGQPSLRAEPLGTNAFHVPWDTVSPFSFSPAKGVPGEALYLLPPTTVSSNFGGKCPPPPRLLLHCVTGRHSSRQQKGPLPWWGGHTPQPISICSFTKGCHSEERGTPIPALMCPSQPYPSPSPPAGRGWGTPQRPL